MFAPNGFFIVCVFCLIASNTIMEFCRSSFGKKFRWRFFWVDMRKEFHVGLSGRKRLHKIFTQFSIRAPLWKTSDKSALERIFSEHWNLLERENCDCNYGPKQFFVEFFHVKKNFYLERRHFSSNDCALLIEDSMRFQRSRLICVRKMWKEWIEDTHILRFCNVCSNENYYNEKTHYGSNRALRILHFFVAIDQNWHLSRMYKDTSWIELVQLFSNNESLINWFQIHIVVKASNFPAQKCIQSQGSWLYKIIMQ